MVRPADINEKRKRRKKKKKKNKKAIAIRQVSFDLK